MKKNNAAMNEVRSLLGLVRKTLSHKNYISKRTGIYRIDLADGTTDRVRITKKERFCLKRHYTAEKLPAWVSHDRD